MGCDIHLCVEKRRTKKGWFRYGKPKPNSSEWEKCFEPMEVDLEWRSCNISSDKPWSNRHYGMFAKLADVRNYGDLEHLPIRGFPKDACLNTYCKYLLRVVSDESFDMNDDMTVPKSRAEYWIKDGSSYEIIVPNAPSHWGNRKFITHPDFHSPNWCSCQELEDAVKEVFYAKEIEDYLDGSEE